MSLSVALDTRPLRHPGELAQATGMAPLEMPALRGRRSGEAQPPRATSTQATLASAIELLQKRGFAYVGRDPIGLPCYQSPSGVLVVAVGSCRTLAYAPVGGRFEVIASSRTETLVCRITLPGGPVPDAHLTSRSPSA
jgi:hypothetical protein